PIHNPSGDLIGCIHVASDISERVSFEEELSTLVQEVEARNSFVESVISNLQSGLIVVDTDFRIKMVNAHVVQLCKKTKEQFIGSNLADISPELYEDVVTGKTAAELLASFGSLHLIIGYTCVDLKDTFSSIVGYIINFKDLTEIIRIRQELRQKERLSAMGEVVARVAHEMRNPLFGMTAAAQILEMELSLDPKQQELMNSLLKESHRLNNLVEELLHTTRETRINKKRVNLISVIDISLQLVEAMLNEQKISLNKNYYGEVWLFADLEKLEQVLLNLIKNAMEATKAGGFITVAVESDDSYVSVIVTDNGEGILPENIDRIFDVFYTTKKNGTGMGLSICRNIVEAHGGSLNASNNPDGGARFILQLPLGESLT
ncbi:MAG: PAS domain-containing sensor histidine kinase, partial [Deltaproteobacteria bacterium HGW-Deltaproteobacteria-23]